MKRLLHAGLVVAALLVTPVGVAADPPPPEKELNQLLKREPINRENWSTWVPRLREWSGEHFSAAFPAFVKAFGYIKTRHQMPGGKRLTLPKELEKDPVAWMVLAGAYLHDPAWKDRLAQVARLAGPAAQQSVKLDRTLARSHYYLFWAWQQEQLAPQDRGGPAQPNKHRLQQALNELREARKLDPSAGWESGALSGRVALRAEKWDDAEEYLRAALDKKPDDRNLARDLARAINKQEFPFYDRKQPYAASIKPLVDSFPDDGGLAAQYALALHHDRKPDEAKAQLARSRELGTDPAKVIDPNIVRQLEGDRPRPKAPPGEDPLDTYVAKPLSFFATVGRCGMWFTIFYASVMLLMCVGGLVLARWTRGAGAADLLGTPDEKLTAAGQVSRTRHESRLTRFYSIALLLALVLFYLSLPFVFVGLLIVFVILLVLALFLRRDRDTADVHSALLRASGGGMGAVFKAMFARVGTGSFGLRKDRGDCPKLFAALEEVARRVDTEPVDEVWISPGADFGVHQEGRGPFGMFGGRKRVLTLGLCVLDFLSISELKAILAHEYAHFSHADTHWNRFLFQVTLSLRTAMREMARTGGWVTYVNPFYWFFWLYGRSYALLSAGFSRSREYLADRMACSLYGADVFARALRKVCTDGTHFEMTVYDNIVRLLKEDKAYVNMYLAFRRHRDEAMTEQERRKLHRK
ncbi:MAG TPA: M48 family metalloprotease, partial [Gemmataceae bacterium]|nr:M48 family metalloprotease [Gemmataceae bacterium]